MSFADQELSADYDAFRRKGAYRRFKDLLEARGMLQNWHDFETRAIEEALLRWCKENCIQPVDASPD